MTQCVGTYQTAEIVPIGETRHTVGFTYTLNNPLNPYLPNVQYQARSGVTNNFELGFGLTFGHIIFGGKYNFLDKAALDVNVYTYIPLADTDGDISVSTDYTLIYGLDTYVGVKYANYFGDELILAILGTKTGPPNGKNLFYEIGVSLKGFNDSDRRSDKMPKAYVNLGVGIRF